MSTENEAEKFCPVCGQVITLEQLAADAHSVKRGIPTPYWVHDACADDWSEESDAESEGQKPTVGDKIEKVGLAMVLLGKIFMLLFVLAIFGFVAYACFSIAGTK